MGGDLATLVTERRTQEHWRAQVAAELAQLERPAVAATDLHRLERDLLGYLDEWRAVLRRHLQAMRGGRLVLDV